MTAGFLIIRSDIGFGEQGLLYFLKLSILQPGDDHAQDDNGNAKGSAAGELLMKDQDVHDIDTDKTGRRDTGHYRYRHMDQGNLIDHQGGEEKSVGYDDAGV